eukprot:CAMPEP_0202899718 /NCGR_PEP_ID=MMETSP1392-20130828/7874_1 /ASSEMBLY_ACC=CAM_ASM_000868 /TAXON_ID=225041 /ORGANISM="Chlamydomonas chlamydogama, Strain SAG 11-48b" /LENGTH=256 /DNA_ID=CAMNT_0049585973 /DNA_START=79 /DNA_END=846 /DNA_ORIENTATION=-
MSDPAAKKAKLDSEGDAEGVEDQEVNEALERVLADLEKSQQELDKVNDEASDAVLAVEQEFNKKRRPIYHARNEIIKQLSNFWQTTLVNHHSLRETMTDDDIGLLGYCTELVVEDDEDIKSGFSIILRFADNNPYFKEKQLVKKFKYEEDGVLHISGEVPSWNEEYAPEELAAGSKRSQPSVTYGFFSWFSSSETLEPGVHDETADVIKEEVWPNPLKFYLATDLAGEGEEVLEGEFEGEEFEELGEGEEAYEGEE